jgi:hypothetical protein
LSWGTYDVHSSIMNAGHREVRDTDQLKHRSITPSE